MMAIAKEHHETINHFQRILGRSKVLAESAKFGQIYDENNKDNMMALQGEAMRNAVYSGKLNVIRHVQEITENCPFPKDAAHHVLDKEILKMMGHKETQNHSILVDFSKDFPLFNEKVEVAITVQPTKDRELTIPWPKLCCMSKINTSSTIYVKDIDLSNNCEQ